MTVEDIDNLIRRANDSVSPAVDKGELLTLCKLAREAMLGDMQAQEMIQGLSEALRRSTDELLKLRQANRALSNECARRGDELLQLRREVARMCPATQR